MKRIILFIGAAFLVSANPLQAQEPADALRYSWYVPGRSARIQAVGGAMGSLGGDISATFVNPAGLAFYRTGDLVLGPYHSFDNTKATYLSGEEVLKANKFKWGTTGLVFGGSNSGSEGVKSGAFSIAYNRTADFNSNIVYRGLNNQTSFANKFLEEIRNNNDRDAHNIAIGTGNYRFGTALALQTGWIDTAAGGSPGNYDFRTLASVGTGLWQQNTIETRGGIHEFALGLAVNLRDKLMIGGTLSVPVLSYHSDKEFLEEDATNDPNNQFNYAKYTEELKTTGAGFNLKAGLIYKPQEFWRLGLAFHSPTFFSLTDEYNTAVTTDTENFLGTTTSTSNDADFLNDYGEYSFRYQLTTPYKIIGSISYVLREIEDVTKQRGFLTADVEFINYKASSFHPDEENGDDPFTKDYLKQVNNAIDKAYKSAFNFRVGGELKFTVLMIRAGAAYYGNPYKDINGENGSKLNLSGGLGYRNKGFFADLTYVHSINKDRNFPYRLQYAPYSSADIRSTVGNVYATFGFKF